MSFGDDLDRQRAQIMRAVRHASDGWAAAMRAHKLAPPDAGFASRLRDLAEAAGALADAVGAEDGVAQAPRSRAHGAA